MGQRGDESRLSALCAGETRGVDTRGNARRTETSAAKGIRVGTHGEQKRKQQGCSSGAKVRVGDNIHDGGSPPRGFTPPLGSVGSRRQRRQEAGLKRQRNRGEDGNWKIAQTQGSELRPTDIDCVVCGYGTRRRVHRWVGGNQAEGNWAGKTAERTDRQTEALQDQRSDAGAGRRAGGERDPREACRVKSSRKTAGIAAGDKQQTQCTKPSWGPSSRAEGKGGGGEK